MSEEEKIKNLKNKEKTCLSEIIKRGDDPIFRTKDSYCECCFTSDVDVARELLESKKCPYSGERIRYIFSDRTFYYSYDCNFTKEKFLKFKKNFLEKKNE